MDWLKFVWVDHFVLACVAAIWFFVGALMPIVVMKRKIKWLESYAIWIIKSILKLFGPRPGMLRTIFTIFAFNSTAIFIYMSTGFHPWIPQLIALTTGFNISICLVKANELEEEFHSRFSQTANFYPGPRWVALCGVATALLELPCFFYGLAMGMTMGEQAMGPSGNYLLAWEMRVSAYLLLVVPTLLISAICESIAIRGTTRV